MHTVPFLDEGPGEDPHEARQTHHLNLKLLKHAVDGGVKLRPAAVQLVVHHLVPMEEKSSKRYKD